MLADDAIERGIPLLLGKTAPRPDNICEPNLAKDGVPLANSLSEHAKKRLLRRREQRLLALVEKCLLAATASQRASDDGRKRAENRQNHHRNNEENYLCAHISAEHC
jgi:hypothetical protein